MPSLLSRVRSGLCAATAAILLACWGPSLPAAAESTSIARVDRNGTPGENVHFTNGESATTTLFELRVDDDTTVAAYCVDVSRNVDYTAAYTMAEWPQLPGAAHAGKIVWIVRNSYPVLPLEEVAEHSGIDGLSAEQAIAGTKRRSGTSATASSCVRLVSGTPVPHTCTRSTGTCWTMRLP